MSKAFNSKLSGTLGVVHASCHGQKKMQPSSEGKSMGFQSRGVHQSLKETYLL